MVSGFLNVNSGQETRGVFTENNIFPILSADELLFAAQRKKWLDDIKTLAAIPSQYYQVLYQDLIENFVRMVQVLPVNNEARLFSLLDEGLLRGMYVLELARAESKQEEIEPLMQYVLFSAALLLDIGFVLENRLVIISDKEGGFIREWYPHTGAMLPEYGYYKIRRGVGMPTWLCRRIATILAKQTMPEIGFNWIAKDAYALNVWLSFLSGDKEGVGALGLLFNRAEEMLEAFKQTQEFFIAADIEILDPLESKDAEKFLKWLQESLGNGKVGINKPGADVQGVKGGALVNINALINRFAAINRLNADKLRVAVQKLGVAGKEVRYRQVESKDLKGQPAAASSLFGHQAPKGAPDTKPVFFTNAQLEGMRGITSEGMPVANVGILIRDLAAQIVLGRIIAENGKIQMERAEQTAGDNTPSKLPPLAPPPAVKAPVPVAVNVAK